MPNTFTKIASVSVGSGGASTIDFTSIPSIYTDLCLKMSLRSTFASNNFDVVVRFNSDAGSNYSVMALQGAVNSATSFSVSGQTFIPNINIPGGNRSATNLGNAEIYITNYAGSTQKSLSIEAVSEENSTDNLMRMMSGLWTGTAAITSINIFQLFSQYSTVTLYGIKNS